MNGEHITVAFTTPPATIRFPCATGAPHTDEVDVDAYTNAWCLCGWAFTTPFDPRYMQSVEVAQTLAQMQAREHRANPLKGMMDHDQ